jgi:hypothetical protein
VSTPDRILFIIGSTSQLPRTAEKL